MPNLFYAPQTCALASHIVLEEAGAEYTTTRVDFAKEEQRKPAYLGVNPKGRVPALVTARAGVAERYPAGLSDLLIGDPSDSGELCERLRAWRGNLERIQRLVMPLSTTLRARTWSHMSAEIAGLVDRAA